MLNKFRFIRERIIHNIFQKRNFLRLQPYILIFGKTVKRINYRHILALISQFFCVQFINNFNRIIT